MQVITVTGRLGRDAKTYESGNGGEPFVTFTLASDSKIKGEEKTTWYDVIATSSKKVKAMTPYLKKGTAVCVIGDFSASLYDTKDGEKGIRLSINADRIDFNGTSQKQTQEGDAETPVVTEAPKKATTTAKKAAKKTTEPEDIPMVSKPTPVAAEEGEEDLPF